MKCNHIHKILVVLLLMVMVSCSVTKYIPQGKKLYSGANININNPKKVKDIGSVQSELEELLKPKPNKKILGARLGLYYHYKVKNNKGNFITRYLNKKIGEEPVYFSDVNPSKTKEFIKNRLDNRGFFNSVVTDTIKEKKHTKGAFYSVTLPEPYTLESYSLEKDTLAIYQEIKKDFKTTLLKKGTRYNLESFKLERAKIDSQLKNKGYYNFNQDFLIYEVDTNQYSNKKFDLYLRLKKETPQKAKLPYKIDQVLVYPNYNLDAKRTAKDTVTIEGVSFLQDTLFFKPHLLRKYLKLQKGIFYNPQKSKLTSKRLSAIGTYKYVNIQYDESKAITNDSIAHLDAKIYLSPLNKRSIGLELQTVTKSNNFAGPGLNINYRNRNLFNGGEMLSITASAAYEFQIGNNDQNLNGTQLAFGTSLIFPRLIFPGSLDNKFKYGIPKTKISFDSEYLSRSNLYDLASFKSNLSYSWDANKYLSYEVSPININYVRLANSTNEFQTILNNNPFLRSSFDQQFIAGLTFNFTYNELGRNTQKHQFYFSSNLDVAGNLLSLVSSNSSSGKKEFLGLEFAQYGKIDVDARHYINLSKEQTFITRLYAGVGIPYGNSEVLPFTKQFFSGGPYSVRGFNTRSIGPGTYQGTSNNNSFFDRSGDVRLETNLEYRYPIFSVLKGALFADAGNIWLYNQNSSLAGGEFSNNFVSQLAISVGTGIRVDIQSFVIRLDYGVPIKQPIQTSITSPQFNNSVLNFAIGYPF
ncbi:translocation and assembly module lipoprotein TamL [Wenyingzhuangia sp. IMCC45533]